MTIYTITGSATFSTQANRDAARTRVDAALAVYNALTTNVATTLAAGLVHPTTTTMTVSLQVETDDDAVIRDVRRAIYDAWTSLNRPTPCWLSSNRLTGV